MMANVKLSPTVRASYELLGLAPEAATSAELKKAYRRLALLYHPDRNSQESAPREFQKVTEAFELLSDPARVADLNRRHHKEKLHRVVVEGLEITFGSFFGYRIFDMSGDAGGALRLTGNNKSAGRVEDDVWLPIEENNSVLDNAPYDSIEVVYAGKFSVDDEERVRGDLKGNKLAQLPWVVLNNQGLFRFFENDLRGARKCYTELCERIPGNILFTYRLGLCLILEGFKKPKRTLLGGLKADRVLVDEGIKLLRHCLKLGETRTVGRQKCMVIRKVLADVLEKTGRSRPAKALWKQVLFEDPDCVEASFRLQGRAEAVKLLRKRRIEPVKPRTVPVGLLASPGPPSTKVPSKK